MNKTTLILVTVLLMVLLVGLYVVKSIDPEKIESPVYTETSDTENVTPSADIPDTDSPYTDGKIGLSFEYDDSGEGYRLDVLPSGGDTHVKTIVLTDRAAYAEVIASEVPREGPPTITIQVFKNENREWSRKWADSHIQASNINLLMGEVTDTVIGGANAVRYTADGLYPTDTVVVAHGSHVYVISGSYMDETSPTRIDFEPLLQSLTFIPEIG
jgi:hypothetical protein